MKQITTKAILIIILLVFSIIRVNAQHQNALDFDGVDDRVLVSNASAGIANGMAMSMTMWVYPTNTNVVFPDYDGFAGFRKNSNADFYLVQFGNNRLEARFRNSAGTAFDLIDSLMPVNTWVHYALTYDGFELSLFRNGVLVGSKGANGSIASPSETFYIGYLDYLGNSFSLTGKADEVAFWNRALTPAEISCISSESVNPMDAGLLFYYDFNQGDAGGSNSTITTLTDLTGSLNGDLLNFGMTGTLSNFVTGVQNYTPLTATLCRNSPYTYGGQNFTTPGVYNVHFPISTSCDSVTNLVLDYADTSVTEFVADGITLFANQTGAQYAWADCNNGYALIAGETNQSFTPAIAGDYALILNSGGCSDTSVCHNVIYTGISSPSNSDLFTIGKNPFQDELVLNLKANLTKLSVYDLCGRMIQEVFNLKTGNTILSSANWPAGSYILKAQNEKGAVCVQIVKN